MYCSHCMIDIVLFTLYDLALYDRYFMIWHCTIDIVLYYSTLYDSILYDSILYDSILYDSILYESTLKDSNMFNRNLGFDIVWFYIVWFDINTSLFHWRIRKRRLYTLSLHNPFLEVRSHSILKCSVAEPDTAEPTFFWLEPEP